MRVKFSVVFLLVLVALFVCATGCTGSKGPNPTPVASTLATTIPATTQAVTTAATTVPPTSITATPVAVTGTSTPGGQVSPGAPGASLVVESPKDGEVVSQRYAVSGTSTGIAGGDTNIVVLIRPEDSTWWVQPPVEVQSNGDWETLAYVGNPEDVGKKFTVSVIVRKGTLTEGEYQGSFPSYVSREDVAVVRK